MKATGDRIQAEAIKQADLLSCLPTVCCHHPDTILAKHSVSSSSTNLEEESLILLHPVHTLELNDRSPTKKADM